MISKSPLRYPGGKVKLYTFIINTACHIRKMILLEGDFDEAFNNFILEQLRVDFVRNEEYTVLPFIRKYINEFNKLKRY